MRPMEDADILRLRAEGLGYGEIAERLKISRSTAHDAVQKAVESARREMAGIAAERLAVADARIEWLIDKVARMIATDEKFDDRKYKVVISLLERQAKMLGYDKEKARGPHEDTGDWLATASEEKLREYANELAESLGRGKFGKG